ncbi:MAG: APC family permease [Alphaproteobacteria bacterium]|nr:APC family permease [Alphaproteobacteria bacterium]
MAVLQPAHGAQPTDEEVLEEFGYKQELKRNLSAFDLFGLSFSTTSMTTGVFLMFGPTLAIAGTVGEWSLVLLVGLPSLAVAFAYACLYRRVPIAGQEYQWGMRIFGRVAAMGSGWIGYVWALVTVVAVSYVLASTVLPALFSYTSSATETTWIAVGIVCALALLLIFSTKAAGRVTRYGAISEMIVIGGLTVLLLIVGAIRGHLTGGSLVFTHKGIPSGGYFNPFGWKTVGAFWLALTVVFFSAGTTGWQNAGAAAEEGPNPTRTVPRAMYATIIIVTVMQTLFLIAMVLTIRPSELTALSHSPTAVSDVIKGTLGTVFEKFFLVLVAFNILACAIAVYVQGTRYTFAMARDGNFPASNVLRLAHVHRRLKTPIPAILLATALVVGSLAYFGPRPSALTNMIGAGSLVSVFLYLAGVTLYAAGGHRLPLVRGAVEKTSRLQRWILVAVAYIWLLFMIWTFHESSFKSVWLYLAAFFAIGVIFILSVVLKAKVRRGAAAPPPATTVHSESATESVAGKREA